MTTDLIETTPAALAGPLTADEQQDLRELEGVIDRGQKTFLEVGQALLSIRDERLYRETHTTFEAYINERWPEIGRRRAYQLLDSVGIAKTVTAPGLPAPENERQVRPLAGLPADQQQAAWKEAAAAAKGEAPTGKQVEAAVAKQKAPAPAPAPAQPAPAQQQQMPTPLPSLTPLTPLTPMPQPLAMGPSAPDQQALVHAALLVAWCDEQATEARRRMARLMSATAEAGGTVPTIEIPGDMVAASARVALDSQAIRAQIAMLVFSVNVVDAA